MGLSLLPTPEQEVTICLRRRDRFLSMVEPIVSPGRPLFGEKKSVRGKSVAIAEIRTNSVKHTWRKLGCYLRLILEHLETLKLYGRTLL